MDVVPPLSILTSAILPPFDNTSMTTDNGSTCYLLLVSNWLQRIYRLLACLLLVTMFAKQRKMQGVAIVLFIALASEHGLAWSSNKLLNRRNALEFAGWSTIATLAPPSIAEEIFPEVEVVPVGDAKKVC